MQGTERQNEGGRIIRRGDVIRARTNAELLNKLLGKNYKAYMKCRYPVGEGVAILLHEFDVVTPAGWQNTESEDGTVVERYCKRDDEKLKSHRGVPWGERRILFEKRRAEECFIFKGVFELPAPDSEEVRAFGVTSDRRVWKKTADVFDLDSI